MGADKKKVVVYIHMLTLHYASFRYSGVSNPKFARCEVGALKRYIEDTVQTVYPSDDLEFEFRAYVAKSRKYRGKKFFHALEKYGYTVVKVPVDRPYGDPSGANNDRVRHSPSGALSGHIQMDIVAQASEHPDVVVVIDGSGIIIRAIEYLKKHSPETDVFIGGFSMTIHDGLRKLADYDLLLDDADIIEVLRTESDG